MTRDEALECLGLAGDPTAAEIRSAFQAKALRYHPDHHGSADEAVREVMTEKMRRLLDARDVLLNARSSGEGETASSTSGHVDDGASVSEVMEAVQVLVGRRQFNDALRQLDALTREHGEQPVFVEARANVLVEMERFADAYRALGDWERLDPQLASNPDFQHFKANIAADADLYTQALLDVRQAHILAAARVPAFVGTEASIYIRKGDAKSADRLIDELRLIDPTHPLVSERAQVMNIGGNYVDKSSAANSACCVCIILELLLDCF